MTEVDSIRREAGICVIRISRPKKKNALSLQILKQMHQLISDAIASGARAVVIWGDGQCFSAGADFSSLNGDAQDIDYDHAMRNITKSIEESPAIFIAAIDGYCIGAGLDLAMACDFRVATTSAKFSIPAVKVGILYNPERLEKVVRGLSHLGKKMLLLGEVVTAEEAVSTELVSSLEHEKKSALDKSIEMAKAASAMPWEAQAATKQYLNFSKEKSNSHWQGIREKLLVSEERRAVIMKNQGDINAKTK